MYLLELINHQCILPELYVFSWPLAFSQFEINSFRPYIELRPTLFFFQFRSDVGRLPTIFVAFVRPLSMPDRRVS
jgi:hypothetical protein